MALNKTLRNTRATFGDNGQNGKKNIMSVSFFSQDLTKPDPASTTKIASTGAASGSGTQSKTIVGQPDVPRNITVTVGGTAGDIAAGNVVITGKNVEGKTITENIAITVDTAGTYVGTKAFASVTSAVIPQQDGAGATYAIGQGNVIGTNHRALSTTAVKLYKKTSGGAESLVDATASTFSASAVEDNTVTLDVNPTGTNMYRVYGYFVNWHLNPVNGQPSYGA